MLLYYVRIDRDINGNPLPRKQIPLEIPIKIVPTPEDSARLGDLCEKICDWHTKINKIEAEQQKDDWNERYTNANKRILTLDEFLEVLIKKETTDSSISPIDSNSWFSVGEKTPQHVDELNIAYETLIETLNYVFRDIPKERESDLPYLYLSNEKEDEIEQIHENNHSYFMSVIQADHCKCAFLYAFVVLAFEKKFYDIVRSEQKSGGILELFKEICL